MLNKYPGKCVRCGTQLSAQAGQVEKLDGKWTLTCSKPCEIKPQAAVQAPAPVAKAVGELDGVMKLFAKAKQNLKFPAIVLGVPGHRDWPIRINVAGEKAKFPGSLTVVTANRNADGERDWIGRIVDGVFTAKRSLPENYAKAVGDRLAEFAADPAKVGGEDGRMHARCCFCRKALSDPRSTAHGYGKKCADNFGLAWGGEKYDFAEEVAMAVSGAMSSPLRSPFDGEPVDTRPMPDGV